MVEMMEMMAEWFDMGGYAAFVWPAYLFGILVLGLNLWLPLYRHRRLIKRLKRNQ